jgi:tetratricopeptide (TPR) repeat protein
MHPPGFHGRSEELAWLRGLWEACTQRDPATARFCGGPRAAFILAESGIGKSRLVQALYQQLTTDPAWDPPELNYWPDAFNDQGMQLRVTPDMTGHVAKGPPRFAWLGARWQPTDVRNVSDRRTVLPELRHSIVTHAEILKRQGGTWQDATGRIRDAIRREGVGETLSQVADAAVPFGGLLMKIAKGALDLAKDRMSAPRSFEQAEEAANRTLVDEVCECMHALVDGAGGLPTVLWLDDAQWIDAETQDFVRRLWLNAQRRQWPLLVVVTHWEREWRELSKAAATEADTFRLTSLEGQPGVEVRVLSPAPPESLDGYLQSRLPGLTPPQRMLLLEKAAGNFLTMVENVGQLVRMPPNFVNRDTSGPLSPAGERKVQEWESDRQKRVEQRFSELAPELQELLGWGSHLGMSFLREVVEDFAEHVAGQQGAGARLAEAVDPLVILGQPSEHMREFRDKAFHHVAARHFRDYGQEHAEALDRILRARLVEWVNNSFDAKGDEIWPNAEQGIQAPPRSVTGLSNEEARDVLGMAVSHLQVPAEPDWSDPVTVAAVRATFLLVVVDWRENLWDRVRERCNALSGMDWRALPETALSKGNLNLIARHAETAGALKMALCVRRACLVTARRLASELDTPQSWRDVSVNLGRIADIERMNGDLQAALARYEECLAILRRLANELDTPQSWRDVSVSLGGIADIEQLNGGLQAALARHEESLAIRRRLARELGTSESDRDVSISLGRVAEIKRARGDDERALALCEESLVIARRVAEEMGKPESDRDVSVSLARVADIERSNGNLDAALVKYQEILAVHRRLAEELGTPESWRDLSVSLGRVADIEHANGDLDAALVKCEECLVIRRRLADELGTPQSRRDVGVTLGQIADIERTKGHFGSALGKYKEILVIHRRLAEQFGTPQSRRDVIISLHRIAGIEQANGDRDAALAKFQESLAIGRQLAEQLGTPRSLRDVSASLNRIAYIEQAKGDLDAALAKYEEGLAICRRLAEQLGTPESHRDVRRSLFFMIRTTNQNLDSAARSDLSGAAAQVERSLGWVLEFEQAPDHSSSSADTLAAWWEHAAAIAQATGRTDDHAHAQAKARHWRDLQRELRAAEPDQDGTPPTNPS